MLFHTIDGIIVHVQRMCGGHPDYYEAATCAETHRPEVSAMSFLQRKADPRVKWSYAVVKMTPELIEITDLNPPPERKIETS